MVVVRLMALECMRTKGELTEEPYINIWSATPSGGALSHMGTWGPVDIKTGQTRQITSNGDHMVVEGDRIQIELYERDYSGPGGHLASGPVDIDGVPGTPLAEGTVDVHPNDDLPGVVVIYEHGDLGEGWGEGSYVAELPPSDEAKQRYKIRFELYRDQDRLERGLSYPYSLRLLSIHCHDAQEYPADHVFIKVNGERVWEPHRMETGQTRELSELSLIPIRADTTISLWEEDSTTRNDLFGEFDLHVDENFDFFRDQPHTFHPDLASGSARYTLQYRVEKPVGPYVRRIARPSTVPVSETNSGDIRVRRDPWRNP